MWGGRFAARPDDTMKAINASIGVDQRMWREDIAGSKAHAAMLAAQGIITQEDQTSIHEGLDAIAAEIEAGTFPFSIDLEDIHLNIEARLTERIGDAGKRLHTGRSRNDQVATDFRLWVKRALDEADDALYGLMRILVLKADAHHDWIMPGFTHLQTAQPITLGHHLLAYVEMFNRDRSRLTMAITNLDENPLGAAALAGTPYPIDRLQTTASLGFNRPMNNSLDAVAKVLAKVVAGKSKESPAITTQVKVKELRKVELRTLVVLEVAITMDPAGGKLEKLKVDSKGTLEIWADTGDEHRSEFTTNLSGTFSKTSVLTGTTKETTETSR